MRVIWALRIRLRWLETKFLLLHLFIASSYATETMSFTSIYLPLKGEGESSGSSSSSSSEDSEWNESDEAEENEDDDDEEGNILDLDICPPGCAQADFDKTVAFREQRLDVEDEISDQKRLLDAQRKEAEALAKRSRSAQQSLQQATMELQAFQACRLANKRKVSQKDLERLCFCQKFRFPNILCPAPQFAVFAF